MIFGGFLSINFTPLSTEVAILSTLFCGCDSVMKQGRIFGTRQPQPFQAIVCIGLSVVEWHTQAYSVVDSVIHE